MNARIYKPARNAMQSGKGKGDVWLLEFEPETPRMTEPLMGWTATVETQQQVRLAFDSKEAAIAYAERNGIAYEVVPEPPTRMQKKAYADNFKWGRPENWTH
jgi:NADH dehydrogenase ubiquinone Fe-S protein 4